MTENPEHARAERLAKFLRNVLDAPPGWLLGEALDAGLLVQSDDGDNLAYGPDLAKRKEVP